MTRPSRLPERRRLAVVFAIGAAWVWLVGWVAHALLGDDDWSWAETAARSATGGLTALAIAAVIPPRRLRAVQRPLAGAIHRGTLPRHLVGPDVWRDALDHHRSALWVWRWLFPVILGSGALVCAGAAFFVTGGGLAAALGLGFGLTAGAAACRFFAERRRAVLDDLAAQLDQRDVHAG
ncbi:hypothetical protein [Blastococcus haudaquaticus]|uniref:hypothetical protein n=1 Tax=Blastococcus haudaquaticus TaxID=1938745 RepID=UPI0011785F13|nr:hypothetical protein [Blastococcus haudaquaticus]